MWDACCLHLCDSRYCGTRQTSDVTGYDALGQSCDPRATEQCVHAHILPKSICYRVTIERSSTSTDTENARLATETCVRAVSRRERRGDHSSPRPSQARPLTPSSTHFSDGTPEQLFSGQHVGTEQHGVFRTSQCPSPGHWT
jgi:hypothetical protein